MESLLRSWFVLQEIAVTGTVERITLAASIGRAPAACGVVVVAGDTKVVPRGQGGGLYITATGIGTRSPGAVLDMTQIRAGDCVLVNGTVGDHGTAVLLARQAFGLHGELRSDSASVLAFTGVAQSLAGLRFMRDPTRGGIATVANEIAREGRVVAVVDPTHAAALLALWRGLPGGQQAAVIGRVDNARPCVVLRTQLGGERLLHELEDDPLPRIC
jgi:hydrogenase expression/formation protein HypE